MIDELLWRQQRSSPVEQQRVTAPDRPAPGITGNDPDRTLLLSGASGRDQSSASLWTLHNHHGRGEGNQQTVAGCEVTATDRRCLGLLGQQQTPFPNGPLQPVVVTWIDAVERSPKHRDRTPACIQAGAMGRRIDALGTGQPACTRARLSSAAARRPWGDADRVPTTATQRCWAINARGSGRPRWNNARGGLPNSLRSAGQP